MSKTADVFEFGHHLEPSRGLERHDVAMTRLIGEPQVHGHLADAGNRCPFIDPERARFGEPSSPVDVTLVLVSVTLGVDRKGRRQSGSPTDEPLGYGPPMRADRFARFLR